MIKIGITGQSGFIGTHLKNTISLYGEKYRLVAFKRSIFDDEDLLMSFVSECDVIVHLAALNRHNDPEAIYGTNLFLVQKLINAMEKAEKKCHVIFSSSIQEERENLYGRSKIEGRQLFSEWARKNNTTFTGLIIPNVYGPFGQPYYNSVVATFSHQLTHHEQPVIDADGEMKLIYVDEVVSEIIKAIDESNNNYALMLEPSSQAKVSEILYLLKGFKEKYYEHGIFPKLVNGFELNLFNTFRSYIELEELFPVKYRTHKDERGSFSEAVKAELPGQISFSTTVPGVTRGNHFHTRKIERFAVIKGEAEIAMRRIERDKVYRFRLSGDEPAYVDVPIWYTHNITNTGSEDLYTLFWINEFYNPKDADTFFARV